MEKDKGMERTGEVIAVGLLGWWAYEKGLKFLGEFFTKLEPYFLLLLKVFVWATWVLVPAGLIGWYLYSLHKRAVEREKAVSAKLALEASNYRERMYYWSNQHSSLCKRNNDLCAELEAVKERMEKLSSKPEAKAQEAVASVAAALVGGGAKVG